MKNRWVKQMLFLAATGIGAVLNGAAQKPSSSVIEVRVSDPTPVRLQAIGVELDPHFFSQNITRADGAKPQDWRHVEKRVKAMELQRLRVMVLPHWYEPVNDNPDPSDMDWSRFTFNSPEMQSLYKVLDLAEEHKIDVCIVLWGCPLSQPLLDPAYSHVKRSFMADSTKKGVWITGPVDNDEWAESFSALIQHLVKNRKYSCIKEITPMNEPSGGPLLTSSAYIKMARVLDARFKQDGIRDRVQFNLSDNIDVHTNYLTDCANHLADVADIFNSHTYIFGYATPNHIISRWEKKNVEIAAKAGKQHGVGEFGSNQTVGASRQSDIDRYERGVLITRLALNFLNAGAAGISYWSLFDQYYYRNANYRQMQQLGLWKYVKKAYQTDSTYDSIKKDYEVRPQFHAYALLSRFVKPGSSVHPIDLGDEFAIGTAFCDTTGKWTYLFANATDSAKSLTVANPGTTGNFAVYRYEKHSIPNDDQMLQPASYIHTSDEKLPVTIPPQSVVLCRQQ